MNQCPTCGAECLPSDRFCGHCGAALRTAEPVSKVRNSLDRFRALSAFDTAQSIETSPLRDRVATRAGLAIPPVVSNPELTPSGPRTMPEETSAPPMSSPLGPEAPVDDQTVEPQALDVVQADLNAHVGDENVAEPPSNDVAEAETLEPAPASDLPSVDDAGRTLLGMPSVPVGDFWGADDTEAPLDASSAGEDVPAWPPSRREVVVSEPQEKVSETDDARKTAFGLPSPQLAHGTKAPADEAASDGAEDLTGPTAFELPVAMVPAPVKGSPTSDISGVAWGELRSVEELYAEAEAAERAQRKPPWRKMPLLLIPIALVGLVLFTGRTDALSTQPTAVQVSPESKGLALTGTWPEVSGARLQAGTAETVVGDDGRFRLVLASMPLGTHALQLAVHHQEREHQVSVDLTLHYRFTVESVGTDDVLGVSVETREGWRVVAPRGQVQENGRYRVQLDAEEAFRVADAQGSSRAAFPLSLVLSGPDGVQKRFTETLDLALPVTPLSLAAPARRRVTTADVVLVRGRTQPGAAVSAGGRTTKADRAGVFTLHVPVEAVGAQTVTVEADGAGRRPQRVAVEVERASARGAKALEKRLTKRARARHPKAKRKIRYSALRKPDNPLLGRSVRLGGVVLEVRRDLGKRDVVLFSLCRDLARCPVWLETTEPILVEQGEPAIVYGRFAGMVEYATADGQERSIPRLEDAILIP